MNPVRSLAFLAIAMALTAIDALAHAKTAFAGEPSEKTWAFSASAYAYFVPDSRNYVQPTVAADRRWLHLEARYNYEGMDTGSAWVGYNFHVGEKLSLDFTPMVGGVFGRTTGIAPGYRGTLSWWKLELYSEGEYVFDTGDRSASFFYSWSELSLSPLEWFRFGLAAQRTRVYKSDRDVQPGFLVGVSCKGVDLTAYVFNPDDDEPTVVVAAGVMY
jgi:hypothetical protein